MRRMQVQAQAERPKSSGRRFVLLTVGWRLASSGGGRRSDPDRLLIVEDSGPSDERRARYSPIRTHAGPGWAEAARARFRGR